MFLFKGQKIAKFLKVGSRKKRKDTLEGLACTFYSGYHIVNILGFLGQLSLFKYSTLPPQRKSSYRRNIHELCDFSNKTLAAKTESRLALAHRLQLPILQFLGHKVWFREGHVMQSDPMRFYPRLNSVEKRNITVFCCDGQLDKESLEMLPAITA